MKKGCERGPLAYSPYLRILVSLTINFVDEIA